MVGPAPWLLAAVVATAAPSPQEAAVQARQFREDELLLLSLVLDDRTLTETLTAYGDPAAPYVPIGELARLLDLDVTVSPADRRVVGTLGEARSALTLDLDAGLARVAGRDVPLAADDVGVTPTDVFVRVSLAEKLLPLRFRIDPEALQITLTATQPLPIQERAAREAKRQQLGRGGTEQRPTLKVMSPYRLLTMPAVDVALQTGYDSLTHLATRRYDIRAAADVLNSGFTGYLGSDETGHASTARVKLERRSADGGLLGPIDATDVAVGDVFTPLMTIGPRSAGGRGVAFTTAPLGQTNVFQRITLRGELPIGYEVELYVNDVLRSGQRIPVQGRYEFVDVPLSRGLNVLRIVTYGPQGQRSEQTRLINVGGGELQRGQLTFEFAAIQQDRAVINLSSIADFTSGAGEGKLRTVAKAAYGLSDMLTLAGGLTVYPDYLGRRRTVASAGARGSLLGIALIGDYAKDFRGGSAASLGAAARLFGVAATARHVEYGGGFVDENNQLYDGLRAPRRFSSLDLSVNLRPFATGSIPITIDAQRTEFADGGTSWVGFSRASTVLAETLVSAGMDYRRDRAPDGRRNKQVTADIAASRFIAYTWQVRGTANFRLTPTTSLNALSLTIDRTISERVGARFGVGRSFLAPRDFDTQAGIFFRLPFADLSLVGDYAVRTGWRAGLSLSFGAISDPLSGRARLTRPGAATGGSVAFAAFMDGNGNGQRDAGEAPVAGIALEGGDRKVVTDAAGQALVTGLGDSATALLHVDMDAIDAFSVSAPPQDIEFAPRPGKVLAVAYPLSAVGEVFAHVWLNDKGRRVGLAAVRLRLVRDGQAPIAAMTEYDGGAAFENVRPGLYRLELDPEQAQRLGMRALAPATVTVKEDGTAGEPQLEILFESENAQ